MSRCDDLNAMDVDEEQNGLGRGNQTDTEHTTLHTKNNVAYSMLDLAWRHLNDITG